MPNTIISKLTRIDQKLDDLIEGNIQAHDAILKRLDKLNGSVGEHTTKLAVLEERVEGQDKINWSIFVVIGLAVVLAVVSSFMGEWL
jgi:hypothetical protein